MQDVKKKAQDVRMKVLENRDGTEPAAGAVPPAPSV
jgi:hypothetical protein